MSSSEKPKKPDVVKEEKESSSANKEEKISLGLEPNVAGVLCYLVGFISGIIIFLIEKENRFVRFHAMQSIILNVVIFIAVFVLTMIPFIGWIISFIIAPVSLILWLFMMYKAYQGEMYKLPIIGDFSEQQVEKM